MVKSSNSTGSKDVLLAKGNEQLKKNLVRLQEKDPDETIIVEEYIVGDQYLVEALVYNSKIQIAGIIKQEITQGKRFIITGYGVLAKVPDELKDGIETVLIQSFQNLELRMVPFILNYGFQNRVGNSLKSTLESLAGQ